MRISNILYYTKDRNKFDSFKNICEQDLTDARYQGIHVKILDSFTHDCIEGVLPLFLSANDLLLYLSEYSDNLSDLIIIVDINQISTNTGDAKVLRNLIIEYPEVKFLFDKNPKWKLFNKNEIDMGIRNTSTQDCQDCIVLINENTNHRSVKDSFLSKLKSNDNDSPQAKPTKTFTSLLIKLCRIRWKKTNVISDKVWEILRNYIRTDKEFLLNDIRDLRKQLLFKIAIDYVDFNYVTIDFWNYPSNVIRNIVQGYDNLFDASNLRYAIKQWKYAELDIHSQNLRSTQESRRDNLAICIEEERGQNRFNSYCLFASGYRVLPVTSSLELVRINNRHLEINPSLIVRDFDLQFPDQHNIPSKQYQQIDLIRGFRYHEETKQWDVYVNKSICWSSFYSPTSNQNIGYSKIPILFVSKGGKNVSIKKPSSYMFDSYSLEGQFVSYTIKKGIFRPTLYLPGLSKPISGIYRKFFEVRQIKERFDDSRHHKRNYINTSRQGHEHGTSLDIYSLVKSILDRSRKYYKYGKYIHAAILSNEALEYLNGFHQALMVEAYYINAIAENAISLDAMGVDEETLSEDALIRVRKIQADIKRLYAQKGWLPNIGMARLSRNALNQIYSDCRNFCREKEHFKAEEVFISAMGHLNEKPFNF